MEGRFDISSQFSRFYLIFILNEIVLQFLFRHLDSKVPFSIPFGRDNVRSSFITLSRFYSPSFTEFKFQFIVSVKDGEGGNVFGGEKMLKIWCKLYW